MLTQTTTVPYHDWHTQRVASCLAHFAEHVRPGTCLDLGHDPKMGPALAQFGLTVTGNIHPEQSVPDVAWPIAAFDFEAGPFPFPDSSFDAVTAFEVVEHIRLTPRPVFSEAARVLKPGGLLYLGTPNVCSWAKIRRMFSQVHPYDTSAYSMNFGPRHPMCHVYEYEPWTLKHLVMDAGFDIVDCRTWDTYESDPKGVRNTALKLGVTAALALTGHLKDAAQLWRLRGHQIGLVARRRH